MATKRAKLSEVQSVNADFRVPLQDIVDAFLDASDAAPGDRYSVISIGDEVVITRTRRTVLMAPAQVESAKAKA